MPVVELPGDHVRPAVRSYRGAQQEWRVRREVTEKLKQMSQKEGATLFMTLLAAFDVLLARYSGQEELVVGTPIANRTRVETEELIGCFVNTLVLRVDASGNPQFRELVQRVKKVALEGYAHQDVPFEKLVEELQPKRDLSRTALFQVMFVLQNVPMAEMKLEGLTLSEVEIDRQVAKFDLTVTMWETEEGLTGVVEYSTDLFEAGTMERLVGHWERLLEGIAEDAQQRVWELPLLGEAERRQVVEEWNQTEGWYPRDKTIVELFEEQVEKTPERVAVVYEGESLSYGELNRRANQLARRLRGWGVGPEQLVGLCMKRSLEMVVGLMGVLKAGGAYVPLEPDYPRERLEFMVRDTGLKVVLSEERNRKAVEGEGLRVLSLDTEWGEVAAESGEGIKSGAQPENLAYVIYTSGSTGKPKGVEIEHRAIVNFLWSMRTKPGMTKEDVLLAITTLSFDIAGLELYLPLTVGGRTVIASREEILDAPTICDLLVSSRATVMQATPAMWRMLIEAGWKGNPELKVLCGGEACSRELATQLLRRSGSVWNMYGPTETTIWSAVHKITSENQDPIVIGRPIANTQIYILDRALNPVPVGVSGELHIGGVGLARGYLHRAELTAEKFVADPFAKEIRAQLYKTGDLARYRADGVIEYLGRIDHQVKIRGFRIELGEIEAVLAEHHGVSESVVLAREDAPGHKRLVAYVVAEKQAAPMVTELRNWVKGRLPEYMVPAALVMLQAIPVTQNGKVDRRALPVPDSVRPELEQGYLAPRTPEEEILARIWAEVLKLERVGVHDNFFELGGHSLLATQVISRIGETLQVDLPLMKVFEFPVLVDLAQQILQLQSLPRTSKAVTIKRRNGATHDQLLARLDQLSEEEIGGLLNNMMAGQPNEAQAIPLQPRSRPRK
ncbi:MAG: non-ribosomal peptide synthetase [Verrucomicrobia bacterium]|nr:MAG: non-ribosomal peptide synthetase [Verrucomicrobiota bacterium]